MRATFDELESYALHDPFYTKGDRCRREFCIHGALRQGLLHPFLYRSAQNEPEARALNEDN
jgi:hypothetical protein